MTNFTIKATLGLPVLACPSLVVMAPQLYQQNPPDGLDLDNGTMAAAAPPRLRTLPGVPAMLLRFLNPFVSDAAASIPRASSRAQPILRSGLVNNLFCIPIHKAVAKGLFEKISEFTSDSQMSYIC